MFLKLVQKGNLRTIFSILLIIITQLLTSQNTTFRAITMDNGLSNFVVTSIYKDSLGYIWIGTDVSLDRFDGVNFRHFDFNSPEINKKRVKCIAETGFGKLYVGNELGLWKLNAEEKKLELFKPNEINCGVSALKWDLKSRCLYIGTNNGLYILKDEKLKFIAPDKNVISSTNFITGIDLDTDRNVWLTTKNGICEYHPNNQKIDFYDCPLLTGDQSFLAKVVCLGKTLYIGSSKTGLLKFDIENKRFSRFVDVGSDIITDISTDKKDMIFVATDGNGIHFISQSKQSVVKSYQYSPGQSTGSNIRSNSVYSLLVDSNGIIWVGFYQAGLDYSLYQDKILSAYKFLPQFNSDGLPVRTFLINQDDKLVGTREGLYFINEKRNLVRKYTKEDLRSNLILSLCYYAGEYYIGTYGGGISVLNPKTMKVRSFNDDFSLTKGHGFHFEKSKDGVLWIASSGGLYRYDKKHDDLKIYNNTNSQIYSGNVFYVFFDSSNKGWIATESGLCIFDPNSKTIKSNVFPNGFFNKEIIKVVYEDNKHQLYFCPDKGNIYVSDINMRNFSSSPMTSRFIDRVFLSIVEDSSGNFWLGTDNGLISIKENEDSYFSFGFRDGVPDPVFNTAASYIDDKGYLWLGNSKGLLMFDLKKMNHYKHDDERVMISGFEVNGQVRKTEDLLNFSTVKKIDLSYNENNINISFVSLQYTDPGTVVYEYKLEGYDDWRILPKGQTELNYTNLPPGKYELVVRTEGNKSSERRLIIVVHSFFTVWFWVIFIFIAFSLYFSGSKIWTGYKLLKSKVARLNQSLQNSVQKQDIEIDEKYKYTKVSEKECNLIKENILTLFEKEKPFKNPDLKLSDIASMLSCSQHTLSFFFNQYLNKSYYDFVNEYRIEEFKKITATTDISRYTLTALAEECGFSSRASFFRSFKKITGITPNEYIRNIGKKVDL